MRQSKKVLAFFLSAIISLGVIGGSVLASAPSESTNNPKPGEVGYAHLNHYVTPTEIPDVYKVLLEVSGTEKPTPADVIIVLDASASMQDGKENDFVLPDSSNTDGSRWSWAVEGAKSTLDVFFNPSINPGYDKTRVAMVIFGTGVEESTRQGNPGNPGTWLHMASTGLQSGFIPYSKKSNFESVLALAASNTPTGDTDMYDAMMEVEALFNEAKASDVPANVTNYDKEVRKYVVFLSDGADTSPGGQENTLNKVNELKTRAGFGGKNVRFMTIGLGMTPESSTLAPSMYSNWNKRNTTPVATLEGLANGAFVTGMVPLAQKNPLENGGYFNVPGDQYSEVIGGQPEVIQTLAFMAMDIKAPINSMASGTSVWGGTYGDTNPVTRAVDHFDSGLPYLPALAVGATDPLGTTTLGGAPISVTVESAPYQPSGGAYAHPVIDNPDTIARVFSRDNWTKLPIDFRPVNSKAAVKQAFIEFADKIVKFGENTTVKIMNNTDYFTIYEQYQNFPGMTSWARTDGMPTQTVSKDAQGNVTWFVDAIPLIGTNRLVYYVKFDRTKTQEGLWYLTSNAAYIDYLDTSTFGDADGNPVPKQMLKYQPENIVPGGASGANGQVEHLHDADSLNSAGISSSNIIGSSFIGRTTSTTGTGTTTVSVLGPEMAPIGTPMAPYTPSPPKKVMEETVDEGTENVPLTGQNTQMLFVILLVALAGCAAVYVVKHARKKK